MKKENKQDRIVSPRAMENAQEFGRCARGAGLVLAAFSSLIRKIPEARQAGRLNSRLQHVIHSDEVHSRGKRKLSSGDITYLEGYEFLNKRPLQRMLYTPYHADIDRTVGFCSVCVPAFDAEQAIGYKGTYTHMVFTAAMAALDFEREMYIMDSMRTELLDKQKPVEALLSTICPTDPHLSILLAIGLEFYQVVNGHASLMSNQGPLSLRIVKAVNGIPPTKKL